MPLSVYINLCAWIFLKESLLPIQYFGVAAVILGCLGLSYSPENENGKEIKKRWIPFAASALLLWGISQTLVRYAYTLPEAHDANMALYNTLGGFLTLGIYGFFCGRKQTGNARAWLQSFIPMGVMALGDLFVIIALSKGPSSIVSPISGAYPLVTMLFAWFVLHEKIRRFQWACIAMILIGIFLSPGSG